jgi:hypothetical protein
MSTGLRQFIISNPILYSITRRIILFLKLTRFSGEVIRVWKLIVHALIFNKKIIVFHYSLPSHLQNVGKIPKVLAQSSKYLVLHSYEWKDILIKRARNDQEEDDYMTSIYNPSGIVMGVIFAHLSVVPATGKIYGYPIFAKRIHFFHSLASLEGCYTDELLIGYNYYYCAGKHHMAELPRWLERIGQQQAILIPGGYPKLDTQIESSKKFRRGKFDPQHPITIVYAPTMTYHGNENGCSLRIYGMRIVQTVLLENQLRFRPHPVSFKGKDAQFVQKIIAHNTANLNFSLDKSENYSKSYSTSDVMITDLSGTGFTFAFGFERPVIFIDRGLQGTGIQFSSRERIGRVCKDVSQLNSVIRDVIENHDNIVESIKVFRKELICNLGHSERYFVDHVDDIVNGQVKADWLSI